MLLFFMLRKKYDSTIKIGRKVMCYVTKAICFCIHMCLSFQLQIFFFENLIFFWDPNFQLKLLGLFIIASVSNNCNKLNSYIYIYFILRADAFSYTIKRNSHFWNFHASTLKRRNNLSSNHTRCYMWRTLGFFFFLLLNNHSALCMLADRKLLWYFMM